MANPTDLDTGDVVPEAWVDAVSAQVVRVYASPAARDADIPSPGVGQTVYINSNDTSEGIYTYTTAGTWRRPWTQPWGHMATATVTSNQSGITALTDITGLTVTFTAVANRRYRVSVALVGVQSTAGGIITVITANGSNTQLGGQVINVDVATNQSFSWVQSLTGVSAGSFTVKVRAVASAGSFGTSQAVDNPATLIVEDIGPNGAPT